MDFVSFKHIRLRDQLPAVWLSAGDGGFCGSIHQDARQSEHVLPVSQQGQGSEGPRLCLTLFCCQTETLITLSLNLCFVSEIRGVGSTDPSSTRLLFLPPVF